MIKLVKTSCAVALLAMPLSLKSANADSVFPEPTDYSKLTPPPEQPTGPTMGPYHEPIIPPGCGMECPGPFDNYPGRDLPERLPVPLPPPWIK